MKEYEKNWPVDVFKFLEEVYRSRSLKYAMCIFVSPDFIGRLK
jgi:hypothetical protein